MVVRTIHAVCGILLLFILAAPEGHAGDTDVTVNDTRDLPDPSPNLGPDCNSTLNTCTLRAAIQRANHQTGTHTIRLPVGTFGITRTGRGENDAETGDLDIKGNIIIIGVGAKETRINGFGNDRVFDVRSGSLLLQSLAVTNGNSKDEDGGGIRALGAPVTLNRVHLHLNRTDAHGGGIATNSDLSIVRTTVSNNQAGISTGGVFASNSGFTKNALSLRESTISGNTSTGDTGGLLVGVRYNISILHSTIAFNGSLGMNFVTFAGFGDPVVTISHTILSNNAGGNCFSHIGGPFSFTSNVDSDASCELGGAGGNLVVDPQLSTLADNGGQTPTHVFNNPLLIDEGDPAGTSCSGIDQRGLPRPVELDGDGIARCDIGAIELQGPVGVAVLDPENTTVEKKGSYFSLSYLWRVPPVEVWRDLKTLDLRIVDDRDKNGNGPKKPKPDEILFWVRWSEAADTFQLVDPITGLPQGGAFPARSNNALRTADVSLDLKNSSSKGSGPAGQEVTLHLALSIDKKSKHDDPFQIQVTAVDDRGQTQQFLAVGSVAVDPPGAH